MKPLEKMMQTVQDLEQVNLLQHEFYPKTVLPKSFFDNYPFLKGYENETTYLNDNQFVWQYSNFDEVGIGGEFHFPEIEQSLALTDQYQQRFMESVPGKPPEYVLLIDDHPHAGDGIMIFMVVPENQESHEIWLQDNNGLWSALDLDLKAYIAKTAKYWCLYNWPFFFQQKPDLPNSFREYLKKEQKQVNDTFENHPFTSLKLKSDGKK